MPGLLVFMQVGHADILQVLELLVVVNFSCARSADFFADLAHIDLYILSALRSIRIFIRRWGYLCTFLRVHECDLRNLFDFFIFSNKI